MHPAAVARLTRFFQADSTTEFEGNPLNRSTKNSGQYLRIQLCQKWIRQKDRINGSGQHHSLPDTHDETKHEDRSNNASPGNALCREPDAFFMAMVPHCFQAIETKAVR